MTLPVADFLQRWLLHVPLPQTRVVRVYGQGVLVFIRSSSGRASLSVCPPDDGTVEGSAGRSARTPAWRTPARRSPLCLP
jgi:hypothetical protein